MSIVADQVRHVDSQLDRVHLATPPSTTFNSQSQHIAHSPRVAELQSIIKSLSSTSSAKPLLSSWRISMLLEQAALAETSLQTAGESEEEGETGINYETELEWLLVSKATVQTYGLLLNTLLEHTIPLSDDIWYWDEVLGSYTYTGIYTIQTSPLRLWTWSKDIYADTKERVARVRGAPGEAISARDLKSNVTGSWKQFYDLVRESIQERSVVDLQRRVLSPIALCRSEARRKQRHLKRLREMSSSGLGVLVDEGLNFGIPSDTESMKAEENDGHEWKVVVERSIALMDTVLCNVTSIETGVSDFEDNVFASVENDPELSTHSDSAQQPRPVKLSRRLQHILNTHVPNHIAASQCLASEYGRPSRLVRYWLPASLLLLSSTTLLRIFANRRAEIITWIRDLASTARDFWINWVIEPSKKVIGTIRHDKDSEVAIMSKESLKGDRDSLERMVVDFAIDNPVAAGSEIGTLNESQIAEIRHKVKEGDLTPVLRVYESDLKKPFQGTIRGDLVRSLLIQVQKTKVDVEVAISGIDALLKSQELVFGFVGLTPGILVSFTVLRYLSTSVGSRRGLRNGKRAGQTVRVLRNIDRILTLAVPATNNLLSYKDHGLLLCEVHVLRTRAKSLFPGEIEREFLEDVGDLCDIGSGIQTQLKVLERIRWGYSKWLR
ncbi:ATP synthase regulation protein NCA2-domain-containing protein [Calycina marina]|uniref:ATP synthase regulation protein NCA2-domain-containing protein n=1 Tax=Calycina marina TaxID=1763456 RepID=A0A9P7Z3B0_9HELO|nr:ATP synthase regulation protein NCA2-domain-containing protein [Calycina marina]